MVSGFTRISSFPEHVKFACSLCVFVCRKSITVEFHWGKKFSLFLEQGYTPHRGVKMLLPC